MKVLLTGASGFLGGHMAERLIKEGYDVLAMTRRTNQCPLLNELGVDIIKGDMADLASLHDATRDVDSVIHLAAYYTFTGKSELYQKINVNGTKGLVESALGNGVTRFIHCSSTEAIGPVLVQPGDENTKPRPTYEYGRSKLASENIVRSYADAGLEYTIMRPSGIYGPRNIDDVSYWTIVSFARNDIGTRFFIGSGKNLVQFCHVFDVVDAFILALKKGKISSNNTYIVSDSKAYTYLEVYNILSQITKREVPSLHLPRSLAKIMVLPVQTINNVLGRNSFLYSTSTVESVTSDRSYSVEKARKDLGFVPKYDLRRGLEDTISWYRENGYL